MLWVALTARNAGLRPSALLEIPDPIAALDFDMGCALRLLHFDNQVDETRAKRIAYEVGVALFGEGK